MSVIVTAEIPGAGPEEYARLAREVEASVKDLTPSGWRLHVAGPVDGDWRIIELWDSQEAADSFFSSEEMQRAIRQAGIPSFKIKTTPVHTLVGNLTLTT